MAHKLIRSKPQVAANPRISSGGKTPGGSSAKQPGAKKSNGPAHKHSAWHAMFSNMACRAAHYAGHPLAFLTAVLLVRLLRNAPAWKDGFFLVPKVIGGE